MGEIAKSKIAPAPAVGSNAAKYQADLSERDVDDTPEENDEEDTNAAVKDRLSPARAFWNSSRRVINPFSDFMTKWDQVIMIVLVWTALVTPFEVSFLSPSVNWLFIFNRLIDCLFLVDMGFTFLLDPGEEESLKENGLPSHRLMAQNYLYGWFTVDLISTMPFDAVSLALEGSSGVASNLKFLRAMRLLRLVKLLRLLRVSRIFERWEDRMAVNFAALSLVKSSLGTLLCSHWIGCLWYITAYIEDADANWVKSTGVDSYSSLDDAGVTTYDKYIASWYFSVMTMSTIGYGDISPVTSAERIVCSLMMLVGAGIYAYVVGSITSTVSNMEASTRRYQELMDMLNSFLEMNNITDELRVQGRAYMRTRQAQGNLTDWRELLNEMSPDLREAIARETHPGWALTSPFFATADEDFQAKAASLFTEVTFPRGEKIIEIGQPIDSLFVIKRGVVAVKGKVKRAGGLFGEDIILDRTNPDARSPYIAMAFTFTVVQALAVESLKDLLDEFPAVKEHCRKTLIWQVVRENAWAYASAVLEVSGKPRLESASNRELVDHYKWKVSWLRMDGLMAVRVFKAVIRIQKVLRGHWARAKLDKSKEDGIGAIELCVKNAVTVSMRSLEEKLGVGSSAPDSASNAALLKNISAQLTQLSQRLSALEPKGAAPPPLPT